METIKLTAYDIEELQRLIDYYRQNGYKLLKIRPTTFWESGYHAAEMWLTKESK